MLANWARVAAAAALLWTLTPIQAQVFVTPDQLDPGAIADERPIIVKTGFGAIWIAMWTSQDDLDGAIGDDLDILVSRSFDNGATWSTPTSVNADAASDTADDRQPTFVDGGEGILVAAWTRKPIAGDADIAFARSFDLGATWSTPAFLNDNADTDSGEDAEPRLCVLDPATVLCVWSSEDSLGGVIGTDADVLFARSASFGSAWSAVGIVNSSASSDSGDDRRPDVATDGAGSVVCVWQSSTDLGGIGTDLDIQFARSTDKAATWGPTAPLGDIPAADADAADSDPVIAADGRGNWMAAWTSFANPGGRWGSDGDILYAVSENNGAIWNQAESPDNFAEADSSAEAHPAIETDRRGTWLIAWDSTRSGEAHALLYARTSTLGAAWTDPAPLTDSTGLDAYRVDLAADGLGRWGAVWTFPTEAFADVGVLSGGAAGSVIDGATFDGLSCAAVVADSGDGTVIVATPTDIPGRYAFLQLPAGTYEFVAFAPGFTTQTQPGVIVRPDTTTVFDFSLEPRSPTAPYVIFGRVEDASTGDPLIAVRVDAFEGPTQVGTAFTCGDGNYELVLPDAAKGGDRDITLVFTSNGYDSAERMTTVAPGVPAEVNADLTKAIAEIGTLTGRVIDATLSGVAGARVEVVSGASNASTTANESGLYLFDALAAGVYTVRASAAGYVTGTSGAVSVGGGVSQMTIFLQDAQPRGRLRIALSPPEAIEAGAGWRRSGTATWYVDGAAEVTPGTFLVEFRDAEGFLAPEPIGVAVAGDELVELEAAYTTVDDPGPGNPADLNADGELNAIDVQIVINAALGIGSGGGDVNDDGATNAVDVQIVINAVLTARR